jgi:DNA repair protein RecN (Recombination protein N)
MIQTLYLKNVAIFSEKELDFQPGLTVITGETGSGKSLLVKSMNFALGSRGNRILVRSDCPHLVVEMVTTKGIIRRILSRNGRTKSFINDEPFSEPEFRKHVPFRADFHGQHDQQRILNRLSHLNYLDRFSQLTEQVKSITQIYNKIKYLEIEIEKKRKNSSETKLKKELIEFKIKEIETINPEIGEDEILLKQFKKLTNSETIFESIQNTVLKLDSGHRSALHQIQDCFHTLQNLEKIDPELSDKTKELESVKYIIQDVSSQLTNYQNLIEINSEQCSEIDDRLQEIEGLKRKFGGSIASVLSSLNQMKKERSTIESSEDNLASMEKELISLQKEYQSKSIKLHDTRVNYAKKLEKSIEQVMKALNIEKPQFKIQFDFKDKLDSYVEFGGKSVYPYSTGFDQVEFYLSTNPGEIPKPLTGIASGGEISRIMLSIKTVFQSNDPVDTLIFDEIDSGISGETAEKVANALAKLAKVKQVICISHLPQIASRANHHLHVTKSIKNNQTKVELQYLNKKERISVLSNLYGSVKMSGKMKESYQSVINTAHG